MKKLTLASLATASLIALSGAAIAAGNGGYTGPAANNGNTLTVAEIQGLNDDAVVVLQGNITQNLGDDIYVFTDGTGTVNVEIDADDWNGQNIGPNDLVIVKGEIDKNGNVVEIDVDEVTLVNQQ